MTMLAERAISEESFKHAERELYQYHETRRELERARQEVIERGLGEMDDRTRVQSSPEWGGPTEQKATALLTYKSIRHMTDIVEAIDAMLEQLEPAQRRMVAIRYWEQPGAPWSVVAAHEDVAADVRTCQRWRDKIVEAIALKMGWY